MRYPTKSKATDNQMIISGLNRLASKWSDLAGARTQDPIIKSDVLYQLSYEISVPIELGKPLRFGDANIELIFEFTKYYYTIFATHLSQNRQLARLQRQVHSISPIVT